MAEEWERGQGTESSRRPGFSFKSSRTTLTAKQSDELRTRLETSELDWRSKVEHADKLRFALLNHIRPAYVHNFLKSIRESDSMMNLHMTRYGMERQVLIA